ncbi:hypothetical protein GGF42_002365 [Coemansia sp. RSA 2424]|nr:hypothetical protein GGF42_002365 [Coemansia sp. RSA 2424]
MSVDGAVADQAATNDMPTPQPILAPAVAPAAPAIVNLSPFNSNWAISMFEKHIPQFCGSDDKMSSVAWTKKANKYLEILFNGAPALMKYLVLLDRLTGEAKREIEEPEDLTAESLIINIVERFPVHKHQERLIEKFPVRKHQERLIKKLRTHVAFKDSTHSTLKRDALKLLDEIGDVPSGPEALANAMSYVCPSLWVLTKVHALRATSTEVRAGIEELELYLLASPDIALKLKPNQQSSSPTPAKPKERQNTPEPARTTTKPTEGDGPVKISRNTKRTQRIRELEKKIAALEASDKTKPAQTNSRA